MILARMFVENQCYLCPGLIVCGLLSTHVCHLWKFLMPSLINLQSSVSRWDPHHTDETGVDRREVGFLCLLVEVSNADTIKEIKEDAKEKDTVLQNN